MKAMRKKFELTTDEVLEACSQYVANEDGGHNSEDLTSSLLLDKEKGTITAVVEVVN